MAYREQKEEKKARTSVSVSSSTGCGEALGREAGEGREGGSSTRGADGLKLVSGGPQ